MGLTLESLNIRNMNIIQELRSKLNQVTELLTHTLYSIETGTTHIFYVVTVTKVTDLSEMDRKLVDWWEEYKRLDKIEQIVERLNKEFSKEEIDILRDKNIL